MTADVLAALQADEPILLATDTVYGLAALPGSAAATRIFELKERPASSPLPWLVSGADALDVYGLDVPAYAHRLAAMFWPGALTLVVRASEEASALGGLAADGTVALRAPDDAACLDLLARLGSPLACTSANLHGQAAPTSLADVPDSMRALPALEPLAPSCTGLQASTIVDCTGQQPSILREGAIGAPTVMAVALLDGRLP